MKRMVALAVGLAILTASAWGQDPQRQKGRFGFGGVRTRNIQTPIFQGCLAARDVKKRCRDFFVVSCATKPQLQAVRCSRVTSG